MVAAATSLSVWYSTRNAQKPGHPDGCARLSVAAFPEPFVTEHGTDAHFWPYVAYTHGKLAETQVSIPVEGKRARGIEAHEAVLMHYLVCEWDGPDHAALTNEVRAAFLEKLSTIPPESPAAQFAVFYWTRGGARIIWRLSKSLHYERYEEKVRGMLALLQGETGLQFDPTSMQWWRCFRLPMVIRDGVAQHKEPWFEIFIEETTIDADDIPSVTEPLSWEKVSSNVAFAEEKAPEVDHALAVCTDAFKREAKKLLKNAGCYPFVFEGLQLQKGTRDSGLVTFPGQVVSRLWGKIAYITPAHIYGLLLPVAQDLADDGGEPWVAKLWRLTQHAWNQQANKALAEDQKMVEVSSAQDRLIDGVLSNFDEGDLPKDPSARKIFGLQHLILTNGNSHYIADRDGQFSPVPLRSTQISTQMRENFSGLLPTIYTDKGKVRDGIDLCSVFGTNIGLVKIVPAEKVQCRVRLMNGQQILLLTPYAIRPEILHHAARDENVLDWWQCSKDFEALLALLPHFAAIHEGGIPGVFLRGPRATGKSMFALGVADLFGVSPVTAAEAFGKYNAGLLHSPVVMADEGLSLRNDGGMSVPDLFRAMVAGSDYKIEQKFCSPVISSVPIRFIGASNNNDLVQTIAGPKIQSRDDSEAMAERLLLLNFPAVMAQHLEAKGGQNWTRYHKDGAWVGGSDPSRDFRIARTLAWFYLEHREHAYSTRFNQRLLVKGNYDPETMARLGNNGAVPDIMTVVVEDLKQIMSGKMQPSLAATLMIDTHRVWIRKAYYVQHLTDRFSTRGSPIRSHEIRRTLDRWITGAQIDRPVPGGSCGRTSWWELNLDELISVAKSEGADYAHLMDIQETKIKVI